uniref:Peptide-N(4)-(N-acetyl-beta-glucosaminyl)asparagine amidase n=1 Tax=Anthurium amnicola TaxID=1678845 RepID=A0A1D1XNE9_9ARAE
MVARRFLLRHDADEFPLDYDTDDGLEVLKFQIFSLTSIPPDEQQILVEGGNLLLTEASDLAAVSDQLRLLSVQEAPEVPVVASGELGMSDEELARLLQAEEEALYLQRFRASGSRVEFEQRVRTHVPQVLLYEDPVRQEAARKTVPVDEIEEKALVSLAKEGNFKPSNDEKDHAFLLEMLFWFKKSFRWVNSPPCDGCGGGTSCRGMGVPLPSEIQYGGSRVEIYWCNNCSRITRFPRYNEPLKLLETRSGRCGEWANCFTLYCRAFGYESRLILDFTDHVWTECFSHAFGRWMHLDPCEGVYDKPLLYEKGWNKNLNYVIAISKDGVHDVTKRYTKKWHEVLLRRDITTEAVVSAVLSDITKECRNGYSTEVMSMLEHRDQKEVKELDMNVHIHDEASQSLPGRQSGSKEWRIARAEFVSDENNSLSSSSCPVRKCIDHHVTSIYTAFSFLSNFSKEGITKSEAVQNLETIKRLLLDLRASSFKLRKAFLDSNGSPFFKKIVPTLSKILDAISLKGEILSDDRLFVSLAGDPVQTALALPVALGAIEEIINKNITSNDSASNSLICFAKSNRISSGTVLASGEELPFGIATSAFDGIRSSKWEEPNGARGCWLIYKVADGKMFDLEEYGFMSGNDAPERDPADWILEGSEDGGSSWTILDTRKSEMFEERFQQKTFKTKAGCLSNTFRFRFLQVRNPNATSRFQIGNIDLYARTS